MNHNPRLALAVRATMAVLLFLVGAFLLALAFGLYTPATGGLRASPWVAAMSGLVFAGGGLAVLVPNRPTVGWAVAMLILACTAAAALWIGVFADPADIRGGIPLISRTANTFIGRVVFVLSGILCLALLVWGLRLGPHRQR